MVTTHDQIRSLLATKEAEVAALRTTLALLDPATTRRAKKATAVVPRPRTKKKTPAPRDTSQVLECFDTKTPTTKAQLHAAGIHELRGVVGPLVRHGYLKKKRGGYVRTDKAYTNGATA